MQVPSSPAPDVIAVARPDSSFRWVVRGSAVAVLVALLVLQAGTMVGGGSGIPGIGLLLFAVLCVVSATFSRADLAEVRATSEALELVGHDGVVRSIPGGAVGALGTNGLTIAGRLIALSIGFIPGSKGRIVVLDRDGRVISARRGGWLPVADLQLLAQRVGVAWVGSTSRAVPGTSLPPPADMPVAAPGPAPDDPRTRETLTHLSRRSRRAWLAGIGIPFALAGLTAGLGALAGGSADDVIGTFVVLSIVFLLLGIGFAVVGNDHRAGVRRVLASGQPWALVEAVVVSGLVADGSARTVGIVHPATGETEWWTVKGGGANGWLQGDDRTWFWAVRDPKGKKAVIATADRSDLALLEKRVLSKLVISEARAQVDHERAGWQHQQAWQEWQAAASQHAHAAAQGAPSSPPVSTAPVPWESDPRHPGAL